MKKYIEPRSEYILIDTADIMNNSQNEPIDHTDPVEAAGRSWGKVLGGFDQ